MAVNRRDFIGGMVASASLGKLAGSLGQGRPASSEQSGQSGRREWMRSGLIDAGGTHEPYIFVVRRGGQRLDAQQISDYEQSESLIKELHEQGVEVFHTHMYKGFGMAAEQRGMEQTREAVAVAHRYGMKADTYIQWNTMMYETFFAEEPRATNWIQRDIAGLPILLPYGYQQSFRYRPCFSNQEYLDYLKKIVRYAVVEVKTDFIHFDNFDLDSEPDSCHCPACTNGFRKFLRTKYSDERRRERFGFENTDFVNPPRWNRGNPPEQMEIIFDPAFQEWIDFRCQLMADALQQLALYIQSLNPEVAIEINPGGITGANRSWESGIDHARLLKFTGAFWSEEDDPPAYHADGRLVSKIRSYKLARTYNNVLLTHFNATDPLGLAEDLAFNQTLGYVGENPLSPDMLRHIQFYRNNRDCYVESEDVTPVAVLRSYASLTYNNARSQLSAVLVEQALIQSGIPFALIFDEHLQNLEKYKVLILPNSECLSDEQLSLIRRYVEGGGGLIVTEQSGLYDEWRRARTESGLQRLVDSQSTGSDYQEHVEPETIAPGEVTRKQAGRGRVAYIPAVLFDGAMPPDEPYFSISKVFWKRPKNWRELIDAVRWAAGEQLPLTLTGPDSLVANCTSQTRKRRFFVHLVNYNAMHAPLLTAIGVQVVLPEEKQASKVTLRSPESSIARPLEFTNNSNSVRFTVPDMRTYALIAIQW